MTGKNKRNEKGASERTRARARYRSDAGTPATRDGVRSLVTIITITIIIYVIARGRALQKGAIRDEVAHEVSRHVRNRRPARRGAADARIVSDRSRFSSKTRNDRDPRSAAFRYIGSEAVRSTVTVHAVPFRATLRRS